jgi:L-ascorbate metabolism protein UlaG (beta-lactamase superfamily)
VGKTLLFDPFITPNPLAKNVDATKIPADYILVSHGDEDHLADAVAIAKRTNALVIANYEVALWLNKMGAPRIHTVNHGGTVTMDGIRVKFVNAVHSGTMPDGSPGANPRRLCRGDKRRQFLLFRRHGADAGHETHRRIHEAEVRRVVCGR